MSLETLLEAARFVEQQELRAKQYQQQTTLNNNQIRSAPFKIVPLVAAVPPLPPPQPVPSLIQQSTVPATLSPRQLQPGTLQVMVTNPTQQMGQITGPGVVEVIQKPLPPTITVQPQQIQTITNGFDKAATLLLEDPHPQVGGGIGAIPITQDLKKQRPNNQTGMMRSGTREVHNKLEKNRRAHLKECFELLKKQLPQQQDEKKTSNLSILHSALRAIQGLKKKERENEHELERLARDKIASQTRLAALKKELGPQWDNIDFTTLIQPPEPPLLINTNSIVIAPPPNPIKEEFDSEEQPITRLGATTVISSTTNTLSVPMLPLPQGAYPQGLVLGVQKVALVSSKNLPLVSSPIAHIIPQLNGKVVPLVNAQYLMKPVVVVSSPNQGSPRPS